MIHSLFETHTNTHTHTQTHTPTHTHTHTTHTHTHHTAHISSYVDQHALLHFTLLKLLEQGLGVLPRLLLCGGGDLPLHAPLHVLGPSVQLLQQRGGRGEEGARKVRVVKGKGKNDDGDDDGEDASS